MSTEHPVHGPAIVAQLALVESDVSHMLELARRLFGNEDAPIYPLDLLAYGALKRNLSTSRAISVMVASWNMISARALLRVHIDTSLRFSAAWLVDKPHDFSADVLKGIRIDKQLDSSGKRMTDAHLVSVRAVDYPWLPKVYETLSGYIHFSGSHVSDSIGDVSDEQGTCTVDLCPTDHKYPEASWLEILECCRESTAFLANYMQGYINTKGLNTSELDALWKQSTRYQKEHGDAG
jgi:hypothetical protein